MSELQIKEISTPAGFDLVLDPASGKVDVDGNVEATGFIGDGSQLSNLPITPVANKAYINWNTSSNAIYSSSNVSSVSSHGSGDETINFINAFVDANYAVVGSWGSDGQDAAVCTFGVRLSSITGSPTNKSATACRIVGGGKYAFSYAHDTSNASVAFYR